MKNKLFICAVIICFCNSLNAQDSLKNTLQLEIGRPLFLDSFALAGIGLGVHYTFTFSRSFEFSIFYNYTRGDDFPSYGRDQAALEQRFIGNPLEDLFMEFPFQKLENHQLGASVGWLFINNDKWKYGISLGGGFVLSNRSETARVISYFFTNEEIPRVLDFEILNTKTTYDGTFFRLAMDLDFRVYKQYIVGMSVSYLTQESDYDPNRDFILSNHLMPSIKIGKRF